MNIDQYLGIIVFLCVCVFFCIETKMFIDVKSYLTLKCGLLASCIVHLSRLIPKDHLSACVSLAIHPFVYLSICHTLVCV